MKERKGKCYRRRCQKDENGRRDKKKKKQDVRKERKESDNLIEYE